MNLDRRLIRQTRVARRDLVRTVGLGLLGGITLTGQAYLLATVVDAVFMQGANLAELRATLYALLALAILRAVLTWAGEFSARRAAVRVKHLLRNRLAAHLTALGPAYARGERSGELVNTTIKGVEALDAYIGEYLPQLALAALVPLAILVFVFPLDPLSGVVLLVTAPLIPLFMVLIGNVANALTRKQWTSLSRMSAHFLDVLQGLTTLKQLGRSRDQVETIALVSDRFRQATMAVLRVAFLSALVLELVATISTAIVAVEVGLRLLHHQLAFRPAFFILLLAPEFYLPLRLLGTRFHAGMAGVSAARRIFEILETQPPQANLSRPASSIQISVPDLATQAVHFCAVSYAYADDRPAVHAIDLTIEPGARVALVGPSGAGKSTIAHLLLRFIEPNRGCIALGDDHHPLAEIDPAAWRQQIAWLPQAPYLFNTTIAENIRLAQPEASPAEVRAAAELAHAHTFIQALPDNYDTLVGERGTRLSGGQLQRIALARAFLKDAPLLVLDEATANLDPAGEQQVQQSIERLLQQRSALIIAHRLATIRHADTVLVLDRGRIVQSGTHDALLRRAGLYQQLVSASQEGSA